MKLVEILTEIGFFAIHSIILIFAWNENTHDLDDKKELLGWIVVALCIMILFFEIIILLKE